MITKVISHMPLLSGLPDTTHEDHGEAAKELFSVALLSATPLLWSTFLYFLTNSTGNTLGEHLWNLVKNGELYIYAATLLAPIFYIVSKDREGPKSFPSRLSFILTVAIVSQMAAIAFMARRIPSLNIGDKAIWLSIIIYFVAVFVLYLALVYHNRWTPDPAARFRADQNDYLEAYIKRRSE